MEFNQFMSVKNEQKRYSRKEAAAKIKSHLVQEHGSIYKASRAMGISDQHLSLMFGESACKKMTPRLLKCLDGEKHEGEEYYTFEK